MHSIEKELLEDQRNQFFRLERFLREKKIEIDEFCDLLPGVFYLNPINSIAMVYLDNCTRKKLEIAKEKVETEGMKVVQKILDRLIVPSSAISRSGSYRITSHVARAAIFLHYSTEQ